ATNAFAAPKGVINVGRKLAQFNVIAKPGAWDPTVGNSCNGARIFFAEDSGGAGHTPATNSSNPQPRLNRVYITDCKGTDGDATVTTDEKVSFAFFIRVMGPATSSLNLVCAEVVQSLNDNLCLIDGAQTINKGNSFTKIGFNIADDEFAQVLWSL